MNEQISIEMLKSAEFQKFLKKLIERSTFSAFCYFRAYNGLTRKQEQLLAGFSKKLCDDIEKNLNKLLTDQK